MMKKYKVERLAVVKLTFYVNAKSGVGAAKAMLKHEEDLDDMDIEYVLSLDEMGTFVEEIIPRTAPKKNRIKPLDKPRARG